MRVDSPKRFGVSRRAFVAAVSFGLVMVFVSGAQATSTSQPVTPPSDANGFAVALSKSEGVSVETAFRIIRLSPAVSELAERLDDVPGFAGLWLDWAPSVVLTVAMQPAAMGVGKAAVRQADLPPDLPISVVAAEHSFDDLVKYQDFLLDEFVAAALETVAVVDVDVRANGLVIEVAADDSRAAEIAYRAIDKIEVPVSVKKVSGLPVVLVATLSGGGHLAGGSSCTSGFSVRNTSTGAQALLTAGHCSNSASQAGVTLGAAINDTCPNPALSGQTADRQIHTIPIPHTATNSVFTGGPPMPARTILSAVADNSFYVGQPMEKYGRTSGYRTGTVQIVSHANTTCGGLTQLVRANAVNQVGDSGGPVFQQNLALGITQATTAGGETTTFSRIQRSTSGTNFVACIKSNCAP